jgi:dimethylglycine dehydrogenase
MKLDVAILGEWKVAEVVADSLYDPSSARARM